MVRPSKPTMFGKISDKNVTFLVDISGSMYRALEDVKEHLIQAITEKSLKDYDGMFNVIAFSDEVHPWASTVMPCTSRTVAIATDWIRSLECKTSTNTQEALMLALQDSGTDAIYLVTDGLPNDKPSLILRNVKRASQGRPIHCLYISDFKRSDAALEFLRDLAKITNGSLHLLSLDTSGGVEDVKKVSLEGNALRMSLTSGSKKVRFSDVSECSCSSLTSDSTFQYDYKHGDAYHSSMGRKHFDNAQSRILQFADSLFQSREIMNGTKKESSVSNLAASLMKGRRVLARRDSDGFYYLGRVSEVNPSNTFTVRFDRCPALNACVLQQETLLSNMISYQDALQNDIHVGEKVLAPFKDDGKYEPGTVVEGADIRQRQPDGYETDSILVSRFDGITGEIPKGVSVRISDDLHERIRKEIFLPESYRRNFIDETEPSISSLDERDTLAKSWTYGTKERSPVVISSNPLRHFKNKVPSEKPKEPLDRLKTKIERQIEEGEMLLQKLYLEDQAYAEELGYAPSVDTETTTSDFYERYHKMRPAIDERSFSEWRDKVLDETCRSKPKPTKNTWVQSETVEEKGPVASENGTGKSTNHLKEEGYHKHRLELLNHWEKHKNTLKYSVYMREGSQTPEPPRKFQPQPPEEKASYQKEQPKRKRKIAFRTTTVKSYTEPRFRRRQFTQPRPNAKEYHTSDGVPFPPSTDSKFKHDSNKESWTISSAKQDSSQPINIITNRPIEYFANGHADRQRNDRDLTDTRNAAWGKRERDLAENRSKKETILRERQEFQRMSKELREHDREKRVRKFKEGEEQNRRQRSAVRDNFMQFQKDKEERAQKYKQERLDAMREKRMYKDYNDTYRERAVVEAKEKKMDVETAKENHRRKAFEAGIENELKMQEKKLARLRKIHESRLNKEDTRTDRAYKTKDFNDNVKDQSRQIYRASILP